MTVDILSKLNTGGSGIDLRSLASDLATATVEPRRALIQARIDRAEVRSTSLERLSTQMRTLSETFAFAQTLDTMAPSSDSPAVAVRTLSARDVQPGKQAIGVQALAQAQVLEFGGFASPAATVGAGTLTVEYGGWSGDPPAFDGGGGRSSATLTLNAGTTLTQLSDALNKLPGVTARVVDVGDGTFSLGVISETGAGNALRLTAGAGSDPAVAALDMSAGPGGAQRQAAQDAMITVDGIAVRRPTNTVDDLIPGLSLTLTATTAAPATVGASFDTTTARELMEGLVYEVNQLKSLLGDLTARGVAGAEAGGLAGDATAAALRLDLDRLVSAGLPGFGDDLVYLSRLGVSTDRSGTLRLDTATFDAAIAADPSLFEPVLRNGLAGTGPGVTLSGMPGGGAAPGRYSFERDPATGQARLNGLSIGVGRMQDDGRVQYAIGSGPLAGVTITVDPDIAETGIDFGRSLVGTLRTWIDGALSSGGGIGRASDAIDKTIADETEALAELDDIGAAMEARNLARFAAMEAAITMLNSTGDYIQNLVDGWNAQNN